MTTKIAQKDKEKGFKTGDTVVYPSHGVGKITGEEVQVIAGHEMRLYVISFDKDKMILRVPKNRAEKAGLRQLSTSAEFKKAIVTLKGKAKVARGMWSKRAQEYETKINSGSVVAISEVLRDLHRNVDDPNRSYSERMIYESALDRFTHEYAAAESIALDLASKKVRELLERAKLIDATAEAA
jgi:CarD family transcriptional regulator